jgi:hypothetical protein
VSLESDTSHVQQNIRITQGESWGTGTEVTNSRLRAGRRHAPDDDIEFILLRVTNFFFPVCDSVWMQPVTNVIYSEGEISSKANTRIPNLTYNVGVHSRLATSSWLYDGSHTGCTLALQYYHL